MPGRSKRHVAVSIELFAGMNKLDRFEVLPDPYRWVPRPSSFGPVVDRLLAPTTVDAFLRDLYQRQDHWVVTEQPGRFSSLLPLKDIDQTLETHRVWPARMRIYHKGNRASIHQFAVRPIRWDPRSLSEEVGFQVEPVSTMKALRDGATLTVGNLDEILPRLRELSRVIEYFLRLPVSMFAFVSCGTEPGVPPHWDYWDTFALQVHGEKHWQLYGNSREQPLRDDVVQAECPAQSLRSGTLRDGDLLYIPRGHWHSAISNGTPSVHITINIKPLPYQDFLLWLSDVAKSDLVVRSPIPDGILRQPRGPKGEGAGSNVPGELEASLFSRLSDAHFLSFRLHQLWHYPPRPSLNLQLGAFRKALSPNLLLRATARFGFRPVPIGGTVRVRCSGSEWQFHPCLTSWLEGLGTGQVTTLNDLVLNLDRNDHATRKTLEPALSTLLEELLTSGFLEVSPWTMDVPFWPPDPSGTPNERGTRSANSARQRKAQAQV
jgi:hypothetical protein